MSSPTKRPHSKLIANESDEDTENVPTKRRRLRRIPIQDSSSSERDTEETETIMLSQTFNGSYSENDDKKIIMYFKEKMSLLKLKDEDSIYQVLRAKYFFQKSIKSLRHRFLNVILPNLYKYDVMNDNDTIDFYDAAQLAIPEEYIKLLNEKLNQEMSTKNRNVSQKYANKRLVAEKKSPKKSYAKIPRRNGAESKLEENISVEGILDTELINPIGEEINIPKSTNAEISSVQTPKNTIETEIDINIIVEPILDFVLVKGNEDTVYVPIDNSNLTEIKDKLLKEFGISKIQVVAKETIEFLKKYIEFNKLFDTLVIKTLTDNSQNEELLKKYENKLIEFEKLQLLLKKRIQIDTKNYKSLGEDNQDEESRTENNISLVGEFEDSNAETVIPNLSKSIPQIVISSKNNEEASSSNKYLEETNMHYQDQNTAEIDTRYLYFEEEPSEFQIQGDIETEVVRSIYYEQTKNCSRNKDNNSIDLSSEHCEDHTYCKNCSRDNLESSILLTTEANTSTPSYNLNANDSLQNVKFSKRCLSTIKKEKIDIGHLINSIVNSKKLLNK